ncbi:MAG: NERD domain-containing protein [Candidatus Aenigmatarchaeota archaeon]
MEIEKIESQTSRKSLEEILKTLGWKDFEDVVAEIFRRNNFLVRENLRIKVDKRFEIDLVASRSNLVFCVECKRWSGGRYKKSILRKSIEKQEERARAVEKLLLKNELLKRNLKIGENFTVVPLIVTLMEEDLVKEKKTFVVPIDKLNSFLLDVESLL